MALSTHFNPINVLHAFPVIVKLKSQPNLLAHTKAASSLDLEFHATNIEAMKTLIDENEVLLLELHKTQEALEQKQAELASIQDMLASLNRRLERMRASYPNYWEMENMYVSSRNDGLKLSISDWIIEKSVVGGQYLESMHFAIDLSKQGVIFPKLVNGAPTNTWAQWDRDNNLHEILILTADSTFIAKNNKVSRRNLSTTEWLILRSLPRKLAELITTKPECLLGKIDSASHLQYLSSLDNSMKSWNLNVRHDSFNIVGMRELPQYRSVTLKFSNLSLGNQSIEELKFTLSTVDPSAEEFGKNPRLEFHEDTNGILNSWFAETQDTRGCRLELRFSMPNDMDLAVWLKLSDADRILIAGVISSLPENLKLVRTDNSHFIKNRENWIKTSFKILEILKATLAKK